VRTLTAEDVKKYVPSEEIRAWVQGRDATCRWPGCSMPAHYVKWITAWSTATKDLPVWEIW